MAFVVIKSTPLSAESKKRLGDRLLYALQAEGIKPGETVIRYEPEDSSVYLDGTLVDEAVARRETIAAIQKSLPVHEAEFEATKPRRKREDLAYLKDKLISLLRRDRSLSSFEAQSRLNLTACDWAPATLRRMFHELEESKQIRVEGQKRGTRYHWIVEEDLPEPKLEKA